MTTTKPLADRVAIVTGASSGIGEAAATSLAAAGAAVALAARRTDRLRSVADRIAADGGQALPIPTDVTDRAAVAALAERALREWGRIDILVNNAGVMPLSLIAAGRVDDWDRMIDVNVKGLLYGVAAVLPTMLDQESGHIINVSSLASRRPIPTGVVYAATKFAVRCISDGLRLELSSARHIRVTDIEPGVVATELMDHIPDADTREAFLARWEDNTPLTAQDIANAIVFAASQPPHVNVNEILLRPTDQPT